VITHGNRNVAFWTNKENEISKSVKNLRLLELIKKKQQASQGSYSSY
jgi:hypothetical protein